MNWATGLMVYGIIWWVVLFMVLPWGVRTAEEAGEQAVDGSASSAPVRPRILIKAVATTVVAGLVWLLIYALVAYDPFGLGPLITGRT